MTATPGLLVHRITPLCQLQDLGRTGYQRFGVSRSGAMDPYSLRLANLLAGNPQGEGCLEFALAGAVFEVTAERLHFALVGNFPVIINDEIFPANASYTLAKGEKLEIGASDATVGTHGYLAVLGGFAAKPQLGSVATHLRSGIGGFGRGEGAAPTSSKQPHKDLVGAAPRRDQGNTAAAKEPAGAAQAMKGGQLSPPGERSAAGMPARVAPHDSRQGTILPTRLDECPLAVERQLPDELLRGPADVIRAVTGPQAEFFSDEAIEKFFEATWHIAPSSDRMGYRLAGDSVEVEDAGSMISEAVSPGSVQITARGEPIVLMADCGTVGGYPKIATVIGVDRGRLAQLRSGAEFAFEKVTVEKATDQLRSVEARLHRYQHDVTSN